MNTFHFFFLNNNKTENHNGNFSPRFLQKHSRVKRNLHGAMITWLIFCEMSFSAVYFKKNKKP